MSLADEHQVICFFVVLRFTVLQVFSCHDSYYSVKFCTKFEKSGNTERRRYVKAEEGFPCTVMAKSHF